MSQSVLFRQQQSQNGKQIAIATLNQEKALNSLSLEMAISLKDQLEAWARDESVACVFLEGAGPKAFCAGGDVQALYRSAIQQPGGPCEHAEQFFDVEYRLDYLLHTYPKPVICWGDGIVMGGGLGLMMGCSHAVVTENTRLAMPEITIGLYPDVGGSWFLNQIPGNIGLFLALTGVSINARDCLYAGLSSYAVCTKDYNALVSALAEQDWSTNGQHNQDLVDALLRQFSSDAEMPEGKLQTHEKLINSLCSGQSAKEIIDRVMSLETDDGWLIKARESLKAGAPTSALIIYQQLQIAKNMSLIEVFQSEYQLSTNVLRYPDFAEGVRALLVDKDRNPQWQYRRIEDVPEELLASFFTAPETGSSWPVNPLADLGS